MAMESFEYRELIAVSEEARKRLGVGQIVFITECKIEVLLTIIADQQDLLLGFIQGPTLLLFNRGEADLPL